MTLRQAPGEMRMGLERPFMCAVIEKSRFWEGCGRDWRAGNSCWVVRIASCKRERLDGG